MAEWIDGQIAAELMEKLKSGKLDLVKPYGSKINDYTFGVIKGYLSTAKIKCKVAAAAAEDTDFVLIEDDYLQYLMVNTGGSGEFVFWTDKELDGIHPDVVSAYLITKMYPEAKARVVLDDATGTSKVEITIPNKAKIVIDDNRMSGPSRAWVLKLEQTS
jgi:hypothetical protein